MFKIFEKIKAGFRLVRDYYRARIPARLGLIGTPVAGLVGPLSAWALTRIVGFGILGVGAMVAVHRHNDRIRAEVHDQRDKRQDRAIAEVRAKHERIEAALREQISKLTAAAEKDAAVSDTNSTAPFPSKHEIVWPKAAVKRATKR